MLLYHIGTYLIKYYFLGLDYIQELFLLLASEVLIAKNGCKEDLTHPDAQVAIPTSVCQLNVTCPVHEIPHHT